MDAQRRSRRQLSTSTISYHLMPSIVRLIAILLKPRAQWAMRSFMPIRGLELRDVGRVECARHDIQTECYHDDRFEMMPAETWTMFYGRVKKCQVWVRRCGWFAAWPVCYFKRRWRILNVLASWYLKRGCRWKMKKARDETRQGSDSVLYIQDGAKARGHTLYSDRYLSF